ncbi:MAG: PAS domain-containing protein [Minwuia sp.]|nr:PAS domain-containing protein [Minwuia sp.]
MNSPDFLANLDIRDSRSRAFAHYWSGLPRQGLVPARGDFDPCTQGPILSTYIIHELVSPDFIRVHLAGTGVREQYGAEITGTNYLDFVEGWRRENASRSLFVMCEQPCGILAHLRARTATGKQILNESIGLPMRDRTGAIRLIYYQSNTIHEDGYRDPEEDMLLTLEIEDEVHFDIGAGLPDFQRLTAPEITGGSGLGG